MRSARRFQLYGHSCPFRAPRKVSYLSCHATYWLADGTQVPLPQPTHHGHVGDGYVLEQLHVKGIEIGLLRRLAHAQQVEYKICNDEYRATAEEMQNFRTLFSYVQKAQRGEPLSDPSPQSSTPSSHPLVNTAVSTEAELDAEYEAARQQDTIKAYQDFLYRHKAHEKHYAEALARVDELLHPGGTKHTGSSQRPVSSSRAIPSPSVNAPSIKQASEPTMYNETSTADAQLRNAEREFRAGRMSLEEFRQIKKVLQREE